MFLSFTGPEKKWSDFPVAPLKLNRFQPINAILRTPAAALVELIPHRYQVEAVHVAVAVGVGPDPARIPARIEIVPYRYQVEAVHAAVAIGITSQPDVNFDDLLTDWPLAWEVTVTRML